MLSVQDDWHKSFFEYLKSQILVIYVAQKSSSFNIFKPFSVFLLQKINQLYAHAPQVYRKGGNLDLFCLSLTFMQCKGSSDIIARWLKYDSNLISAKPTKEKRKF